MKRDFPRKKCIASVGLSTSFLLFTVALEDDETLTAVEPCALRCVFCFCIIDHAQTHLFTFRSNLRHESFLHTAVFCAFVSPIGPFCARREQVLAPLKLAVESKNAKLASFGVNGIEVSLFCFVLLFACDFVVAFVESLSYDRTHSSPRRCLWMIDSIRLLRATIQRNGCQCRF